MEVNDAINSLKVLLRFISMCLRKYKSRKALVSVALVITCLVCRNQQLPAQQVLTLDESLRGAEKNMPLLQQNKLYDELLSNKIKNFTKSHHPIFTLNGQASYQSDVPSIPFELPNMPGGIDVPKEQFKLWVELNQTLYDGGISASQKSLESMSTQVAQQQLQVSLQEVKKQVVRVYFQTLQAEQQEKIYSQTIFLLKEKERSLQIALKNGIIQQNELLKIQTEIIQQEKKLTEAQISKESGLEILSLLTGISTESRTTELQTVLTQSKDYSQNPEITLIEKEYNRINSSRDLLTSRRMPKVGLFGQAGYGSPNPYNLFESDASPFYMIGLRASWNILDWGEKHREHHNITINQQMLEKRKEQKLQELNVKVRQLEKEEELLEKMIERDTQLLTLRKKIKDNASYQLDQGLITPSQFLDEVVAEQQADVSLQLNRIMLSKNNALSGLESGTLK